MTQTHINIAMLAHVDAGKTTLSEALLYKSGSIRKAQVRSILMRF